jgi:poly-gamma-glutamate capsule biosynthesis protein CapA/YwtB (metallophosphatase superfamily)
MGPLISESGTLREREINPPVRLMVVGDTIPGGRAEREFFSPSQNRLLSGIQPILSGGDLLLFNLEAPLCSSGEPISKCGTNFRISPKTAIGLKAAGFSVATLANNHVMDFGPEGLEQTISALNDAGINHLGAAMSQKDASKALQLQIKGLKIAFLNWADGEFSKLRAGGSGAAPMDSAANKEAIQEARKSSDVVVLSVHAGNEYQHFPSPWIQEIYRAYITYGASVVVGSHPHIPQGLEWYRDGLIVYSMGDFFFEYQEDTGTCVSHILEIGLQGGNIVSAKVHPVKKNGDARVIPLDGTEKIQFIEHLNRLSRPLESPEEMTLLWEQGVIRKMENFYADKLIRNMRLVFSEKKGKEFAAGFLFNMFDCQSHSHALQTAFSLMHQGKYRKDERVQKSIETLNRTLEILSGREIPGLNSDRKEPRKRILSLLEKIFSTA